MTNLTASRAGSFFFTLRRDRSYSQELIACARQTVSSTLRWDEMIHTSFLFCLLLKSGS